LNSPCPLTRTAHCDSCSDGHAPTYASRPVEGASVAPARMEVQGRCLDVLGITLRNLIENALRYGAPDEPIEIVVERGRQIRLLNGGAPVPFETLEALKRPFIRGSSEFDAGPDEPDAETMERETKPDGSNENDPPRKVVGLRASAVNLRIGPVTPFDAGRLPTCN
jgi:hypothetical protein